MKTVTLQVVYLSEEVDYPLGRNTYLKKRYLSVMDSCTWHYGHAAGRNTE